jgi:hypothetical protein
VASGRIRRRCRLRVRALEENRMTRSEKVRGAFLHSRPAVLGFAVALIVCAALFLFVK